MKEAVLNHIGIVHSGLAELKDVPSFYSDSDQIGTLEIYPEYHEALDGVNVGQTIVLLSIRFYSMFATRSFQSLSGMSESISWWLG